MTDSRNLKNSADLDGVWTTDDQLEANHLETVLGHGWRLVRDGGSVFPWSLISPKGERVGSGGTPGNALQHAFTWLYLRDLHRPNRPPLTEVKPNDRS